MKFFVLLVTLLGSGLCEPLDLLSLDPSLDVSSLKTCQMRDVDKCVAASVNLDLSDDAVEEIRLPMPGGQVLSREPNSTRSTGGFIFVDFSNDAGDEFDFILRTKNPMEKPSGTARLNSGLFFLEYVGGEAGLVWKTINKDKMPRENVDFVAPPPPPPPRAAGRNSVASSRAAGDGVNRYSIMVYYTPQFAAVKADREAFVAQAIAETNQGYRNNNLNIEAVLHCIEQINLNEVTDAGEMLTAFAAAADHQTADIAFLLVSDSNSCGVAYFDAPHATFGLASVDCAVGYYSFGHEIAHMIGAGHNREVSGANSRYSYANGFLVGGGQRTIMGYATSAHPTRINYYSDDVLSVGGNRLGNSINDNARVLRENIGKIMAVGTETQTCKDGSAGAGPIINGDSVDGGWSSWSNTGSCSVTCGSGTQQRSRSCSNPAPSGGGADCVGSTSGAVACNLGSCPVVATPVNGGWSSWQSGACSKTCGGGTLTRTRSCNNPAPANGGAQCSGASSQSGIGCNTNSCPTSSGSAVDGGWSDWELSDCSNKCGYGTRDAVRTCTNPAPANGGAQCSGGSTGYANCLDTSGCFGGGSSAVDGGWSNWGSYSSCSKTCGGGVATRTRTCTNPAPSNGGAECSGSDTQSASCNIQSCPTTQTCSDQSIYCQRYAYACWYSGDVRTACPATCGSCRG